MPHSKALRNRSAQPPLRSNPDAFAVVGIAGVMPGSEHLQNFWQHLRDGRHLVSEIPKDRWDWRRYQGDPTAPGNKTRIRWGGFMPRIDRFDSLFFGIAPREARLMDPQQRLFLETVYHCIEDAGYAPSRLAGSDTGVYVGVSHGEYGELLKQHGCELEAYAATGTSLSLLPNRVSYFFDFHGPSEPVNTACSSSLVALHKAVSSLESGECEQAVVGGVNTLLNPLSFVMLDKAQMLARDGKCRPFDRAGTGYVRGEGCGAMLIKPLARALSDGDRIYATILASTANHAGRAQGLTAPDPNAQARCLIDTYLKAGIDPTTVSYIETAATGSEIGDSLEVEALKKAFDYLLDEWALPAPQKAFCGLGSVKANIGHLEAASGMAAVFKVLLSMKYRTHPANIHLREPNPYLRLEGSPFYLIDRERPWEPLRTAAGEPIPLRAGVSAFGFGGLNAHVVLEGLAESSASTGHFLPKPPPSPQLILLSARNRQQLEVLVARLLDFLEDGTVATLAEIAHTLRVGRDAMDDRLALIVDGLPQLEQALAAFRQDPRADDRLFLGNARQDRFTAGFFNEGREADIFLRRLFQNGNLTKLARLWVAGVRIDWTDLEGDREQVAQPPRRVSLPSYPFARKRHWFPKTKVKTQQAAFPSTKPTNSCATEAGSRQASGPGSPAPLSMMDAAAATKTNEIEADNNQIIAQLRVMTAEILGMIPAEFDIDRDLLEYGFDSFSGMKLIRRIKTHYGAAIPNRYFFENPTIAQTARLILEARCANEQRNRRLPDPQEPVFNGLSLTLGQQGIWFIERLEPGHLAAHILSAFMIHAPLNLAALRRTFADILERHLILRSRFDSINGRPQRNICREVSPCFEHFDVSELPWETCRERIETIAHQPFDLEKGPLLRIHIFTRGPQQHILLIVVNHIVFDGTSFGILLNEIDELYTAHLQGRRPKLPPLEAEYHQFAAWQETMLAGKEGPQQLAYWRDKLKGPLPHLDLPIDFARPTIPTYAGAVYTVPLEGDLMPRLNAMAKRERVSLFILLLAAYKVLLFRYSHQSDLVVGTPNAGRPESRFDNIFGYFVNMTALRDWVSGDQPFRRLLKQVKETLLDALDHGDYPFSLLVDQLGANQDKSRTPLFQVDFILQNWIQIMGEDVLTFGKPKKLLPDRLNLERLDFIHEIGGFDLTLEVFDLGDRSKAYFQYNPDLFRRETIARMGEQFPVLLKSILNHADDLVGTLPLLPPTERARILNQFSGEEAAFNLAGGIHRFLEKNAALWSDRVALAFEPENGEDEAPFYQSYGFLNEQSNRFACLLTERGAVSDKPVAICLERNPETIQALFAVLKSGAAYLPLDPSYPSERIEYMLGQADPDLVITSPRHRAVLPQSRAQILLFDEERKHFAEKCAEDLQRPVSNTQLVYLTFTSGSSGKPKGVMISHRSLINAYLGWEHSYGLFEVELSHLQMASFSFDVFAGDLTRALCSGGKLVICQRERVLAPERLWTLMRHQAIECAEFVPAVLRVLADFLREQRQNLSFMKLLILGSDSWSVREYGILSELNGPKTRFINSYGVTETTIDSSFFEAGMAGVDMASLVADGPMPIGKPFANTRMYTLDPLGEPTPIGVAGELFLGGEGVARGYWRRPDLTAQRFLPDPFSRRQGARLYRSGDKARFLSPGIVEFLGRFDFQVKLRGLRIELGEIETLLAEAEEIDAVVVQLKRDTVSGQHLVAYLVAREGFEPTDELLQETLRGRLPEYMVPSIFVKLAALPLTPNGKLDRKALPDPAWVRATPGTPSARELSPNETLMAGIWSEVLGVTPIRYEDNFFELGGHSLLVTRVISRIRKLFDIELPLRTFFERPTLARVVNAVESHAGNDLPIPPPIRPVDRSQPLPLSFGQQRLWFVDQLDPLNTAYNLPTASRLSGDLSLAAFERALAETVARHESLRSVFRDLDGRPSQIVRPAAPPLLVIADLSALDEPTRDRLVGEQTPGDANLPFRLGSGPLFRCRFIRLNPRRHVLLLNAHHIVSDAWSLGIFIREMSEFYGQALRNRPLPREPLTIQYGDFAVWQQAWFTGENLQKQWSYWKKTLAGAAPLLELPTDRPRPKQQSFKGALLPVSFSARLTQQLERFGQRHGVTLFMTLLAAYKILLRCYSGRDDILVGTSVANRTQREVEGLIGFFINTLVLRTDLGGNPDLNTVLDRVRRTALDAYTHQDLPFEKLVEELQPQRDLGHPPLVQVMFVLQNVPMPSRGFEGLDLTPLAFDRQQSPFDLTLNLTEAKHVMAGMDTDGQGLVGFLEYAADLFEQDTIARFACHLERILEQLVATPTRRLKSLSPLSRDERNRQLEEWNQTKTDYPDRTNIAERVEGQARLLPDAVALVYREETVPDGEPSASSPSRSLTYALLNQRAASLAAHLHTMGVGPEVPVAVCLGRSQMLAIGFLAILKAGGVYVPLDPDAPLERLSTILDDAACVLVLTDTFFEASLPSTMAMVINTDDFFQRPPQETPLTCGSAVDPSQLAYIVYTSGSTGRPKGIAIPHRAVIRLICNTNYVDLNPGVVMAQLATPVFDAITFELWGALCQGGRVVGFPKRLVLSPPNFARVLRAEMVSHLFLTTALFNQLAGELPRMFAHLHLLLVGGEAQSPESVARVLTAGPPQRMYNVYGPTENTTFSTWFHLEEVSPDAKSPSIGKPISNTTYVVVNRDFQPLPVGVHGELLLGGSGLARGYLNRPELTATQFVPHPFGDTPGERLYRTGDLVRYLTGGDLEFLGRRDHQIKLRGFRIELGEIESRLRACPPVQEAVVVLLEDIPGEKRLVAYVTVDGHGSGEAALKDSLRHTLPDYMVPAIIVFLECFPLTANKKIDKKALPLPLSETEGETAPNDSGVDDPLGEALAGIWSNLLHRPGIVAGDNFFDLGGHSLLATQLISRVRELFEIEIPLSYLFEAPLLGDFTALIRARLDLERETVLAPLVAVDRDGPLPLSFAQQRLWFIQSMDRENTAYHIAGALSLRGDLSVDAMERALDRLNRRQEALRTRFLTRSGQAYQVIDPARAQNLNTADLSGLTSRLRKKTFDRLLSLLAESSFDLEQDRLLRLLLVRLEPDRHALIINMHHIISDGWSLGILLRELFRCYEEPGPTGEKEPPEPAALQYGDFSVWQRHALESGALIHQSEYWHECLAGAPALLNLPTDRPRPKLATYRGGAVPIILGEDLTRRFRELGQRRGATLFMTLLTAFQLLLSRYSGQRDVVVGSPIANRNRAEIEDLIGFFVNTLVFRTQIKGNPSFDDLLMQVTHYAWGAYANQDYPFEKLVEELQPERNTGHNPLFQVMFALQNIPLPQASKLGLSVELIASEREVALFDLTLNLTESDRAIGARAGGLNGEPEGLSGFMEYNADLFDRPTVVRMIDRFRRLLEFLSASEQTHVFDFDLLDDEERIRVLETWNQTERPYPRELTIHQIFENTVSRNPQAPALEFACSQKQGERVVWSYGHLNERADALAGHLIRHGVGPERTLGVLMNRTAELVLAFLATLKAGGAYVPLDPDFPEERLIFMIRDARCLLLLHAPEFAANLPDLEMERLPVSPGTDWPLDSPLKNHPRVWAQSKAMVFFTSGSTGRPKGVSVCHRGVLRLVCQTNYVEMRPGDRIGQIANPVFDAATYEIWGALLNGATVVLIDRETALVPEALERFLASIGGLFITTGLFHQLVAQRPSMFSTLTYCLTGGEVLDPGRALEFLDANPATTLVNMYGPTENTSFSTFHPYEKGDDHRRIPIGKPIANTTVYLMDPYWNAVAPDLPGEICLGGDGLTRGYCNRPDLTARRWLPNPFGTRPGSRLYRSGDLARYLPEGKLDFLGRVDHQVKMRGFRIEPGEIESRLIAFEGVREACVRLTDQASTGQRLIAYLGVGATAEGDPENGTAPPPAQTSGPEIAILRQGLARSLPAYMIPTDFVFLERLPLNSSGKVDYRALPLPGGDALAGGQIVAPRTPTETALITIWSELLERSDFGVTHNFFDLGGHSLLIGRVTSRLKETQGVDFPIKIIFEYPVAEDLADYIDIVRWSAEGDPAPGADQYVEEEIL